MDLNVAVSLFEGMPKKEANSCKRSYAKTVDRKRKIRVFKEGVAKQGCNMRTTSGNYQKRIASKECKECPMHKECKKGKNSAALKHMRQEKFEAKAKIMAGVRKEAKKSQNDFWDAITTRVRKAEVKIMSTIKRNQELVENVTYSIFCETEEEIKGYMEYMYGITD